ncbi:MAG: hypothetical protein NTZ10_00940 [Candidatus Saganbacteria bacterium]|nr:hypothetical protein [Candidatus Saganbacteria bacterium]
MKKIVDEEASFPSPSAKTKINKAIGRYKLLSIGQKWKEHMEDIKFALADLLLARGEEKDYKEALESYNLIIAKTRSAALKGRSLIGKAELAIMGIANMSADEAIKLCKEGCKLLKGDLRDFFVAKGTAVEAELLVKKSGQKNIKTAAKLFDRLIGRKNANPYFRGRALVGKAELILYFGLDTLSKGVSLCEEALRIFIDRPLDYFAIKGKLIEAEMLARRGGPSDLQKAENVCEKVITSSSAHKDLQSRAKLVLAEISKKEKAKQLFEEVLHQEDIDPYLIEKAKLVKERFRNKAN